MAPRGSSGRWAAALWPWLLSLLVTAPLLAPGFVLSYDMVFVPRQVMLPEWLGLGGPLPRAVPVDAVVAALNVFVPGELLQKTVLVALLGAAGAGAARLVPSTSVPARLAAASVYVWNPYVAERLVLGHWVLLVGYACLPWLALAAVGVRRQRTGALPRVVALLVPAALAPSAALIALLTVLPVLLVRAYPGRRRAVATVTGAWLVLNAPWWVPGLLHPSAPTDPAAGVAAFAPRAEGPLGTVGSLLSLGGVWNAAAVPGSRELPTVAVGLVLVLGVCALGVRSLVRRLGGVGLGLLVAGGLGLALALVGTTSVGRHTLSTVIASLPGLGLVRDGQKLVAPLALAEAVAFGLGLVRLTASVPVGPRTAVRIAAVLTPLLLLPDLGWGVAGRLQPVAFPADWPAVRALVEQDPAPGDVVSLPWQSFRRFGWNEDRVVLDPAPRYLTVSTVVDDTLRVGDLVVPGDDPRAAAVGRALDAPGPYAQSLPPLGIRWVLVEHGTPGSVDTRRLVGAEQVFDGADLSLYRLGDAQSPPWPAWWPVVLFADVAALVLALVAGVLVGVRRNAARAATRW